MILIPCGGGPIEPIETKEEQTASKDSQLTLELTERLKELEEV